jgi:hypothetical protein
MMTRKDYVATAEILSTYKDEIPQIVFEELIDEFCAYFESDNPNFDSKRFYDACYSEALD